MPATSPSIRRPLRRVRCAVVIGLVALATGLVAATTALMQGPAGAVSADDLLAAMQRIPAPSRDAMLGRPDTLRRQAEDIYIRRALAAEAERDGLDRDPIVAAALRQARDRVLSDARLAAIDRAALPADSEITRYARDLYRENPERFRTPEQTRASHILIARGVEGRDRARAEALLAQIKGGASFETLAREQSADGASAARGGDLGWFGPGQMVKAFEDAVAALKNPGDLAGVVETQFGFHVVRLDARRPAGIRSFDEVREDLERDVRNNATREARNAKTRDLLRDARLDPEALEAFSRASRKP